MLENVTRRKLRLSGDGVEIALIDWGGDGPLALLHHANGFCAGMWGPVAESLRDHFRIIAMDARGHGDSSRPEGASAYDWGLLAEDLVAVAEKILSETGRERFALGLGHSFGGTLTLTAALRREGLYERLVLVDPVLFPPPDAIGVARRSRTSELAERARRRRSVWADREQARAFFAGREFFASWDPRVLDLYVSEGLRTREDGQVELKCPAAVEAAVFDQNQSLDLFCDLETLRVPAHFLWAKRGNFPRAVYEAYTSRLPQGEIEDVDAGHLIPMERPDLVAEAVLRLASPVRAPKGSEAGL